MHRLLLVVSILLASFGALNAAPAPAASAAPSSPPATEPAGKSEAPAAAPSTDAPATPAPAPVAAPKITYSDCHVDGQYIAMTFDDGPHKTNTPRLLDMLKARHIHATFFLVGENVVENQEIVKRILAEGHEIGNHSWSHPNFMTMNDTSVRDQLQKTQDAITKACGGMTPKLMRPPYGAFTTRQKNWAHGEWGFTVVLWDVDPEDWKYRNAEHVKREILKAAVSGSIVLSHDIHKTTVDAMPEVLDTLIARGFKFVTVSELISMDRPKTKATPVPKATPAPTAKVEPAPEASAASSKP